MADRYWFEEELNAAVNAVSKWPEGLKRGITVEPIRDDSERICEMADPVKDAGVTAREIRERDILNVCLAIAGGDPGDLGTACDMAQEAIAAALREAHREGMREAAEIARTVTAYRHPAGAEPGSGPRRKGPGSILADTIAQAIEARIDPTTETTTERNER